MSVFLLLSCFPVRDLFSSGCRHNYPIIGQFVIQLKHSEFSLPGLERHTEELFPFYLNYDKPCGELALGENCIKIISQDKSLNSLGMFLETQTELLG